MNATPGLIVAAPASGSGKTVLTLGLLRALRDRGLAIAGAKAGPDYIDPAFHTAATDRPAFNLDPWAMRPETLAGLIAAQPADLLLVEGVMGLFDGAHLPDRPDAGSTADLAALTGWPVILVVDAGKQAASAAAIVRGFAGHRHDVRIAGVIFNRVASESHEAVLRSAVTSATPEIPVLGAVYRDPALALPERHLGLVQAGEHGDLERFIAAAAEAVTAQIDLDTLRGLAVPYQGIGGTETPPPLPPIGQVIAVARDAAFAFAYPAILAAWQQAGAEIRTFSPLADDAPDPAADAIYLPGGYPELHAGQLAGADVFLGGLRAAAARSTKIFGECGGYMVLGRGLIDETGARHEMADLLPVETSFAARRLHLGYRTATVAQDGPLGPAGTTYRGHEFHYAAIAGEDTRTPLFTAENARGEPLGQTGAIAGSVCGSFIHLIDRAAA
ncbi:MAG: cobyrinic acid a,c-diamide synthase [Alphaproteobacteria bacterium]|nr:cobyrinic acid a,c-diamide synthase [Alphaproteobacteria bacterium]